MRRDVSKYTHTLKLRHINEGFMALSVKLLFVACRVLTLTYCDDEKSEGKFFIGIVNSITVKCRWKGKFFTHCFCCWCLKCILTLAALLFSSWLSISHELQNGLMNENLRLLCYCHLMGKNYVWCKFSICCFWISTVILDLNFLEFP